MRIGDWLSLAGFVFIAGVSIAGAFRIEGIVWRLLLTISAFVSLALAIARMLNNKRTANRIQKLEENRLSVRCNEEKETLIFEKGEKS